MGKKRLVDIAEPDILTFKEETNDVEFSGLLASSFLLGSIVRFREFSSAVWSVHEFKCALKLVNDRKAFGRYTGRNVTVKFSSLVTALTVYFCRKELFCWLFRPLSVYRPLYRHHPKVGAPFW